MTLISMLIALIIERLAVRSEAWQFLFYAKKYLSVSQSSGLSKLVSESKGQYLWVLLPGILYALVLWLIGSSLVTLVLNTLVLLVCIGCWHYRQLYKQYLNASERADNEAAFLTMQQLSADVGLT
ncbi:MAG: regulatory signaling modulator protein AmpE, partial [Pararheinheimera sp.]|nr:regulatory signaling modulator protein AmpE [Rheinheimera sp.]